MKPYILLCTILFALGACLTVLAQSAHAAPRDMLLVTKADDTNDGVCDADCSLREAIAVANADDTIHFAGDYAIVLSLGTLVISKNLTIDATGHTVSVSGNDAVRVFYIDDGTVVITGLTISHGFADQSNGGGLLVLEGVTFTLNNSTVSYNRATYDGGGMRTNNATTVVSHSTFVKNNAGTFGGAIALIGGTLAVDSSSFFKNIGTYNGGIYADTGSDSLTVANSTLYKTKSQTALYLRIPTSIYNTTIFKTSDGNSGNGITAVAGTLALYNTIVSASKGKECFIIPPATVTANLKTLADDKSCKQNATGYIKAKPLLGKYKLYGGTTKVLSLLKGSPAISAGDDATCAAAPVNGVDQRGKTRPKGPHCDIGAYERK